MKEKWALLTVLYLHVGIHTVSQEAQCAKFSRVFTC